MDGPPLLGPSEDVMQSVLRRSASDEVELEKQRINEAILESSRGQVSVNKRPHSDSDDSDDATTPSPEVKRMRYEAPMTHIQVLLQAVRRGDQTVFLGNRNISDDDMPEIVRELLLHRNRSAWHFADNLFTIVGARVLGTALASAPLALSFLNVSDVHIEVDGATAIIQGVSEMENSQLRTLRLINVGMSGGEDAVVLARTLRRCAPKLAICDLSLDHNDFGEEGLVVVARALRFLSNISTVSVKECMRGPHIAEETLRIILSACNVRTPCTCMDSSMCSAVHTLQLKPVGFPTTLLFSRQSPVICWLTTGPGIGSKYRIGIGHRSTLHDLISAMISVRRCINDIAGVVVYMPLFGAKIKITDQDDGTVSVVEEAARGSDLLSMLSKGAQVHLMCVKDDEPRRRAAIVFAAEQSRFPMDLARILTNESTSYKLRGGFKAEPFRSMPINIDMWESI